MVVRSARPLVGVAGCFLIRRNGVPHVIVPHVVVLAVAFVLQRFEQAHRHLASIENSSTRSRVTDDGGRAHE
ncbi:hypothetical protein YM304_08040 [Ilumatobacter coccineus YM16-304]|uniref:Uncharacterized protein n=1 Tax=Ilumatobacter coccineus (strain NBRC 103263 / KCTC 29153 / YM16-304) TaxID=1313172 RepID=A0A6C7E945_ILUCY|nr:hypothetical protein YM304_08040 [Ilumatobacter coccineus YM16-304]